jgi:hypothetical protein
MQSLPRMKKCSCGRSYPPESWANLPLLGTMDNGRDVGELLELRMCPSCRTTLTKPIGEHAPSLTRIELDSRPDGE